MNTLEYIEKLQLKILTEISMTFNSFLKIDMIDNFNFNSFKYIIKCILQKYKWKNSWSYLQILRNMSKD